jgi:hypothetical protein
MRKLGEAWVCAALLLTDVVYWAQQMNQLAKVMCLVFVLLYLIGAIDYIVHLWRNTPYKWLPEDE